MTARAAEQLASEGGTPVRERPWPLEAPVEPASDAAPVAAFERELEAMIGHERSVLACSSGTSAFGLAWEAANLEGGGRSEVGVPAIGGDAAARAALAADLRVVPIEVEQESGNLSSRGLAAAAGAAMRAIVVTHTFGHPASMPDLLRLAEHHSLTMIEDMSAALGASYTGTPTGALGDIAVLGGGDSHLIRCSDVGAVVLRDPEVVSKARARREALGGPPSDEDAAQALAELRCAEDRLHARRQAAWHLAYELRGLRGVAVMPHARRIRHGYDRYVLRLRSALWTCSLEEAVAALSAEGIPAQAALGAPLHEDVDVAAALSDDERLEASRFAIGSQLARELIAVALPSTVTVHDMNDLAAALRKVAARFAGEPA